MSNQTQSGTSSISPPKVVAQQIAGNLALDFCNTAGEHLAPEPDEFLVDGETFLRWCVQVEMIGPDHYAKLAQHAFPMDAVIQLREAIYRAALAVAKREPVGHADLLLIETRAQSAKPGIIREEGRLRWKPDLHRGAEQLCALLAGEALSLFCSARAERIGVCDGGLCGWVFVDDSRGKRRRWCDMNDCGSRAKAKRFYARRKADRPAS